MNPKGRTRLKRGLELVFVPFAAAFVFVEQVLIKYLNVAMAAFARLPPIARFESRLKVLPPWAAFVTFVCPSLLILPVKLSAVWFVLHGFYTTALVVVLAAKLVATALLARLYRILRPTLMTIPWYAAIDTWFFEWRDKAYAFVRSLPAWQGARALVQRIRSRFAELVSGLFAR
jgi:hypothetical protein